MGHGGATIYLFVLCGYSDGGVDNYPCLYCWKIVACSERDMAYATILVRFVYFMWCSDICPYEWDMAVPLSLCLFYVLTGVVASTTLVCVVGR